VGCGKSATIDGPVCETCEEREQIERWRDHMLESMRGMVQLQAQTIYYQRLLIEEIRKKKNHRADYNPWGQRLRKPHEPE
jgi:Zn ribbon nucleic-acid-binding protein